MAQRYYTEDHEWLDVEGHIATVGITQHACDQLGDLAFVELPDVGTSAAKGDDVAVVESIKAASDIYMPLSGEIVEVNAPMADDCTILSDGPESTGWIWKMKLSDPSELDGLMDAAAYQALVGEKNSPHHGVSPRQRRMETHRALLERTAYWNGPPIGTHHSIGTHCPIEMP